MRQRLIISAVALFFLMLVLTALCSRFDWPPPRLILKYGFPPTGGPTGRTMTIEDVEFVELKPAYFRMGSHFLCEKGDLLGRVCALLRLPWGKQPKHDSSECPPHWVEVSRVFWIARTEVTNVQYERFQPEHKRYGNENVDDHAPVVNVAWYEAQAYCAWLSNRSGWSVDLPSEAEWEAACRAGSQAEFCFGNDEHRLATYAWLGEGQGEEGPLGGATRVGIHAPNVWGLSDTHGNVFEWCADPYEPYAAGHSDASGQGSQSILLARVRRGGAFGVDPRVCRSACRRWSSPDERGGWLGFRPAIHPKQE